MNRKKWYNKRKYADDYYEEKCSSKNKNGWKNKYDSDYGVIMVLVFYYMLKLNQNLRKKVPEKCD